MPVAEPCDGVLDAVTAIPPTLTRHTTAMPVASSFQIAGRPRTAATASSAVQIGIVNSIATTCAIGIIVSARNHPNWAA